MRKACQQAGIHPWLLTLPAEAVIDLTLFESRLLYELALASERNLSTEVLVQRLPPLSDQPRIPDDLPVAVSRLRQKMAAAPGGKEAIKAAAIQCQRQAKITGLHNKSRPGSQACGRD